MAHYSYKAIRAAVLILLFMFSMGPAGIGENFIQGRAPGTAQAASYTFTVDAGETIHAFNKEMLGVAHGNWDHSWGKYFPGQVPRLAEIYRSAHIGLIRYAGGLWANYVMWERSPQKTPYGVYHPDPNRYGAEFSSSINTSNTYNFQYGMDEIDSLATLARAAGAEVMIQVNISQNDPAMWADMVHYTNIEKKYGFKYWELGNEIDLECQQNHAGACLTADAYRERAASYISAMKAVDPAIIILGGASASGHDIVANNWVDTTQMSRYLYAGRDAGADGLSYHWYTDCNLTTLQNVFTWKYDVPDTAWQNAYSRYWSALAPSRIQQEVIHPAGRPIRMGVSELNVDACNTGRAPVNSNQIAALWYADVLGRLAYNGVDFVNWYEGYGNGSQGFPAVFIENEFYPTADTIYLRPSYYTMFMYGNFFGDRMVKTSGPTPDKISLYAARDSQDPNKLYLMVTNLSAESAQVQVMLSGFSASQGNKYALTNPNPLSLTDESNGIHHGSTINGFQLTAGNITQAVNEIPAAPVTLISGGLSETLPPDSVTAIVLSSSPNGPNHFYLPMIHFRQIASTVLAPAAPAPVRQESFWRRLLTRWFNF